MVRGAESVLYGSDAMGGVINIITKRGKGKPTFTAGFEGGSFETFKENAGVRGGSDYSFQVTQTNIGGLSKADTLEQEKDYYGNTALTGKLNTKLTDKTEIGVSAMYTYTSMDIDNSPDATTGLGREGFDVLYNSMLVASVHLDQKLTKWWDFSLKIGNTDNKSEYFDAAIETEQFKYDFEGHTQTGSWQNNFYIGDKDTLVAGIDYIQEQARMQYAGQDPVDHVNAYTKLYILQRDELIYPRRKHSGRRD